MPDQSKAKEVKEKHEEQLRRLPGVVGVGVGGSTTDAKIVILAERITPELRRSLPKALEGVPVEVLESGVIRPR